MYRHSLLRVGILSSLFLHACLFLLVRTILLPQALSAPAVRPLQLSIAKEGERVKLPQLEFASSAECISSDGGQMTIGRHLPERLITVAIEAGPGGGGDSGGDGGGGGVLAVTSDHTPETVLFLVDCSGSMGEFGRFQAAISRVVDELGRLNRRERVYAWLFGDRINRFCGQVSSGAPVVLTNNSKDKIVEWMLGATSSGGENGLEALSEALLVAPDVLYLVTDGDFVYDMSRMTQLLREGNTRVVGIGVAPVTDVFQEFVVQTGGQFDVMYDFVLNVNREQLSNASNRTKTSVAARLRRARHFEAQGKVVASRRLVLELAFGYPGSPEAHMAISMLRHECAMGLESEISENDAK